MKEVTRRQKKEATRTRQQQQRTRSTTRPAAHHISAHLKKQSAARVELLCCGGRGGGHPFVIPVQYRTRVLMLLHFHVTLLFCTDAANGWNKVLVELYCIAQSTAEATRG